MPGVVDEKHRADFDPREDWPVIEPTIKEALAAVARMRAEEGKASAEDLAANGDTVEKFLDEISKRAPEVAAVVPGHGWSNASTSRCPN